MFKNNDKVKIKDEYSDYNKYKEYVIKLDKKRFDNHLHELAI